VRFWEIGLEALLRGTSAQAVEAFGAAARIGTRKLFRIKARGAWCAMKLAGRRTTTLLLRKYLAYKQAARQAVTCSVGPITH
jgi:hypothetical protein